MITEVDQLKKLIAQIIFEVNECGFIPQHTLFRARLAVSKPTSVVQPKSADYYNRINDEWGND